jgi:hypothetical protein
MLNVGDLDNGLIDFVELNLLSGCQKNRSIYNFIILKINLHDYILLNPFVQVTGSPLNILKNIKLEKKKNFKNSLLKAY